MFDLNKNPTVEELIRAAEKEEIFLPEFQREFVWDNTQIKLLIDSLYSGYTINSILTWEGGDELARRRIGGSIKEITLPRDKQEKIVYLLDGQQRTTALLLIFTEKKIFKRKRTRKSESVRIYFDSEYSGDDPELRFIFGDEKIKIEEEEVLLGDYEEKDLCEKFGSRFIDLKKVYLDSIDSSYFNKIKENLGADLGMEYYKEIRDLKDKILSKPIININQKGDLSAVLNIFERINTLNTKLNIYDIMIAKTYRSYGKDYFDLRSFLKMLNYSGDVKKDFFENKKNIELEFIKENEFLDEATQLFLIMEILLKEFKQKEILSLKAADFIENFGLIYKKYWESLRFVESLGVEKKELSSIKPLLKFIVVFISKKKILSPEDREFLEKWFWNTFLYNRYPGAQNEKVQKDFDNLDKGSYSKILTLYKKDRTRDFDSKVLDAYYGKRNQLYNAIYFLFKKNGVRDFYSGIAPAKSSNIGDKLEEHHIFPSNSEIGKKLSEGFGKDNESPLNNIANIALITKDTNGSLISAKNPSEYIATFENEYKEKGRGKEFLQIMSSQLIDEEMIKDLKKDNFSGFIEKRTIAIKNKIKELCD